VRRRCALVFALALMSGAIEAQLAPGFVDSLRHAHHIPELAYAVVSADSVLEMNVLGTRRADRNWPAGRYDRFRIGSNTKTITALIAAHLVKEGRITWDTRFFALFPEMRRKARKVYRPLTLADLLSFRAPLYKYTYTDAEPRREDLTGDEVEQRRQLAAWGFAHKPVRPMDGIHFSNLSYVAAGLMLERASGHTFQQLVMEVNEELGITYRFGAPNVADSTQPWGHDALLMPEPPMDNFKLAWLEAAGNVNASLDDHARFVQEILKAQAGRSTLLSAAEAEDLLFGRERFALGWWRNTDASGGRVAEHVGNPGTFLSKVYLHVDAGRAYILFANVQSDEAAEGMRVLYERLVARYTP